MPDQAELRYRRVLLKLSGEALAGERGFGIEPAVVDQLTDEIQSLVEMGVDEEGEIQYLAVPGPRNAGRHPGFASLDFRVSRTWKLKRGSFMAFLEVSNLTNRQNQCCLDWDLEEDEDTGEAVFERGVDYWMPLLPAIGVLWEF